jgi:hypothetical protein
MSFFDPPYKKIIERAPILFQASVRGWWQGVELAIIENDVSPEEPFRTAVVGLMAMWHAKADPSFDPHALRYTDRITSNALESMPPRHRDLAAQTYRELATALEAAYASAQSSN